MVGDVAVHYRDNCRGEKTVVLLHGYLESLDVWDEFAGQLGKFGYRVIALDLPGHGISEVVGEIHTMEFLADVVRGLVEKAGVGKFTLAGHSMGGYAALAFAKKYPDSLEGLILFHSTPDADTPEKKENRLREIEIVRSGRKEMLARTNPAKGFSPDHRKKFEEEIDGLALQVMLTEDDGIVALLRGMMEREDMNDMLRNLPVPQLFIFGCKDLYIPVESARKIGEAHPQAAVCWLPESGHMGFVEEPEKSLEAFIGFIGQPENSSLSEQNDQP